MLATVTNENQDDTQRVKNNGELQTYKNEIVLKATTSSNEEKFLVFNNQQLLPRRDARKVWPTFGSSYKFVKTMSIKNDDN